jgi:hypothetical protein
MAGVYAVRDEWAHGLTCELQSPSRTPDGRGGENTTWVSVGFFQCRMDAMESSTTPPNLIDTTKRTFGFTLPGDAPRLGIGWRAIVNDVPYLVEKAHDFDVEAVIRRYDVSITEAEWTARAQDDTVRDDDWPEGTPDTNLAGVFGGASQTTANSAIPLAIDNAPGDQTTGGSYDFGNGGAGYAVRFAFTRPQQVGSVRLVFRGSTFYDMVFYAVPSGGAYPAGLVQIGTVAGQRSDPLVGFRDRNVTVPGALREYSHIVAVLVFDDASGGQLYDARVYDPRGEVID